MSLSVVMYHYVRDLPNTPWPRLRALLADDFRRQVSMLREVFEMATLESAIAFLERRYRPTRPLCLLTFDDGLKDHYLEVTPVLIDARIQGVFLVQTSGPEGTVAAVHKNHFLLAAVEFEEYRARFVDRFESLCPGRVTEIDDEMVRKRYRWDSIDVARLKYLVNFQVAPATRHQILAELFEEYLGDERAFAHQLYLDWNQLCDMQSAGMVIGGHSHAHAALSTLACDEKRADLTRSAALMHQHLRPQRAWPFSYPYGDADPSSVDVIRELGFTCAFTTVPRVNDAGIDLFHIGRHDPKDMGVVSRVLDPCIS